MIKAKLSDSSKFQKYLLGKGKRVKVQALKDYLKHLNPAQKGMGKMTSNRVIKGIVQQGGSWGSFVDFFRKTIPNAAKTVYNKAIKPAATTIYNSAIKPAVNYVKDKPLTAISKLAGALSMIPGPTSGPLKALGTAAGVAGNLAGKGDDEVNGLVSGARSNGKKVLIIR